MQDELTLAIQPLIDTSPRVFSIDWQGQKVWVKKVVPNKSRIWHLLQKMISRIITADILKPTVSDGGADGMTREIRRIEDFRAAGFHAPLVLAKNDKWMAISHLGDIIDMETRFNKKATATDLERSVCDCAITLVALHRAGLAHGRARLNDMVRTKDGQIGFIDFEEDLENAKIPLPVLQARDLFLFLTSVARLLPRHATLLETAYATYAENNPPDGVLPELGKAARQLRPLIAAVKPFSKKISGDVLRGWQALDFLSAQNARS